MLEAFDKDLLADYSGLCHMITNKQVSNGNTLGITGKYRCIQGADTTIYLNAKLEPSTSLFFTMAAFNPTFITYVSGNLSDDEDATFESKADSSIHTALFTGSDIEGEALLYLNSFYVRYQTSQNMDLSRLVIPITNFEFEGVQAINRFDDTLIKIMVLEVAGIKLEIFPENDFNVSLAESHTTRPRKVTAFIEIDLTQTHLPVDEVLKIVDNVCVLLSFAKGTWITWPFYQLVNETGELVESHHRRTFTSNIGIRPLIGKEASNELKKFVETAYAKFISLDTDYNITQTIKTLAEAKSMISMGEINALTVATAVDILRAKWAEKNMMAFLVKNSKFSKIEESLQQILPHFLKLVSQLRDDALISEMMSKLKELNRYSFRTVLEKMVKDTNASITQEQISAFIASRNTLVHKGRFKGSTPQERYRELMTLFNFADLMILGLLDYKLKTKN